MHWLDRASAAVLSRTPPHRRVFRDGWGDPGVLAWYEGIVEEPPRIEPVALDEHHREVVDGLVVSDLRFESPAEHLPAAARTGRAKLIAPAEPFDRICLLMAAWNDHGYDTRSTLARMLAAEGVATVMLENPLYGDRRADPGDDLPLATVADFAVMGRAAVVEGMTLLRHYHGAGLQTAVAGYSMGGNIAAFVGALSPFPTAIVPVAAPHSPAPPFIHGVLRNSIGWDALGGDDPATRRRLHDFFLSASVLDHAPAPHTAAAVLVAGTIDGFVPTSAVLALHRHWPGSHLDWIRAGHATLLWKFKDRMAGGITHALDRLAATSRAED